MCWRFMVQEKRQLMPQKQSNTGWVIVVTSWKSLLINFVYWYFSVNLHIKNFNYLSISDLACVADGI